MTYVNLTHGIVNEIVEIALFENNISTTLYNISLY